MHFNRIQLKTLQRHQTHPESTGDGGAFRHIQCTARLTENEAYEASKIPSQSVPGGEDPVCYVQPCRVRHSSCYSLGNAVLGKRVWNRLFEQVQHPIADRDRITMCSLLGASRQIYEEAYRLFWTTNTFSFEDAFSLGEFLGSLTLSQKRHLTNLHVVRKMDGSEQWEPEWRHLGRSFLPALRGLKTLHLCFEQRTYSNPSDAQYQRMARRDKALLDEMCQPWSALRTSPLSNVTVISDKRANLQLNNLLMERCTVAEKSWMAEKIRESLINEEAVAQARQKMLEERASRNESKRRYKARMMLRNEGGATDPTSEQAVVVSKASSLSYPTYDESQQAYMQPVYLPYHQTYAQRIPLASHGSGHQHQVPAVIDDSLNQITVHPRRRDLGKHTMGGLSEQQHQPLLQRDLNDSFDRRNEQQQEQRPKDTLPPQLGAVASAASYHGPTHHDYRPSFHLPKLATGPQNPPGLSLDVQRQQDARSQFEAQQQALAHQQANDMYQAHSLRNNHTQQWNPPDVHYPGARSVGALLPSYAGPTNVDQSLAQEHQFQVLSQHQGARRHIVEERTDERFRPYPRLAQSLAQEHQFQVLSQHQGARRHIDEERADERFRPYPILARQQRAHHAVEGRDTDSNLSHTVGQKFEAETQAANTADPAEQQQAPPAED